MTRIVRGVLEAPNVLRLDEAVELPLHVPVEVVITQPASGVPDEAPPPGKGSTLLALAESLRLDGPADFSERWEEYIAEDERERNR